MSQTNTERLQRDLHLLANDIEHLLHDAGSQAGVQVDGIGQRLREVRLRLQEIEQRAAAGVRDVSGRAGDYVRERPWAAIGIAAAAAFALGLLSRGRGGK